MKLRSRFFVLLTLMVLGASASAYAQDVALTREEQVAAIQKLYIPIFDSQWIRLNALAVKARLDASTNSQYKFVVADFKQVRVVIDTGLASTSSELEAVRAYAEEETGEFAFSIKQLEDAVASIKTITCVKGTSAKKISAIKPVCPKGYKKK